MPSRLKTVYYRWLLPPLACGAILLGARAGQWVQPVGLDQGRRVGPWLFLASILLAVAAPVMLRTQFAHRMHKARRTPPDEFERLQRRLIRFTLGSVYLVPVVCLVDLPALYHAGVVLAALYAVYYQFPSVRRIDFDRRIFRVADEADTRQA